MEQSTIKLLIATKSKTMNLKLSIWDVETRHRSALRRHITFISISRTSWAHPSIRMREKVPSMAEAWWLMLWARARESRVRGERKWTWWLISSQIQCQFTATESNRVRMRQEGRVGEGDTTRMEPPVGENKHKSVISGAACRVRYTKTITKNLF